MTKANDTREANAPANNTDTRTATAINTGKPPLYACEEFELYNHPNRIVCNEDGQPTKFRALSLEEAESLAEAKRQAREIATRAVLKAQAEIEAKGKIETAKAAAKKEAQKALRAARPKPTKKGKAVRFLTIADLGGGKRSKPWIRLAGVWLEQAGFTVRARVRIQVTKGRLVITMEGKNE